jgi:lipoprotein signal peptidase
MDNFFKKHSALLKTTALILMLVIPFLLYAATAYDAIVQVKLLLVLMGADMLYVMLRG